MNSPHGYAKDHRFLPTSKLDRNKFCAFDGEWMRVCRSCNEWLTEMAMRATHEEVVYTG